ncbi:TIGR03364 family FAD-dependent oxidoreductase [Gordonia polyisoprenivorans]|uniref:TIGR03364 family FAD-dependent oxidoreductase n=1 Tax=Gordonia polyisoprenivorans TaxID=84595 RepID=UPI002301AB99|nr:TIGR03364 family FAD-dependent oxidoreductase [Gordonia polyisoprenivorans]WCB38848.1 TIGR03364 family FAD-dependent oxidoreductase [Gordonia polyisoprenivorans]
MTSPGTSYDVVVVGAGIVGLAHAYHARRRGLSVAVVEHNDQVAGASVRNFGHACMTAQSGQALDYARAGRRHWLDLAGKAGFWAAPTGTTILARHTDELAVMSEFAQARGASAAVLLDRDTVLDRIPAATDGVVGGVYLPADLQVDPRTAAPRIAAWLETQGVTFFWRTAATSFDTGLVRTSRGELRAGTTFITVNHDIDRLFPEVAEDISLQRCRLHMIKAAVPTRFPLTTPLFTGWSLLRYSGFETMPSLDRVAQRLHTAHPEYTALDLHQMYTPQPDGTLLIGDTHLRDVTESPFQGEDGFTCLLEVTRELFGVTSIDVIERWQGVYASAPGREFLLREPLPGTHIVTVTTGIGMTTGMGLAESSVTAAFDPSTSFAV